MTATIEKVVEQNDPERGALVMPFYLVCDVSQSMTASMPALNQAVRALWQAIINEPVVDDVARICIMTFSDTARVVVPLGRITETGPPVLGAELGTNYGAAFRELAQTIAYDNQSLKYQGYKVYRPCVFFLTDGMPLDDDWEEAFRTTLTYDLDTGQGMKGHPIFVPFGFDRARPSILAQLAYPPGRGKWHFAVDANPALALKELLDVITKTVVNSSLTSLTKPAFVPPPVPPGGAIVQGDYDPDYV
jgi:uncharacterized protein YegL